MPHPALVERSTGIFDDPLISFDDTNAAFDELVHIVVDQRVRRGAERPAVFYDELIARADFDSMTIVFDSLLVPFDGRHTYLQNFSSRGLRDRRRRPSVVVLG